MVSNEYDPPYYAVIFTSSRADEHAGYAQMADRMIELAHDQPGFLGMDSVREETIGITVSYWESIDAIRAWGRHVEHRDAQRLGRESWYEAYSIRIAKVEEERVFARGSNGISNRRRHSTSARTARSLPARVTRRKTEGRRGDG